MQDSQFETPILFVVFNRPATTAKVLDKIRQLKPRQLFISADGPRKSVKGEKEACNQVRNLIRTAIDWDCVVKTRFLDQNLGCRYGVSSGIDWFFDQVEEGIIIEDDIIPDLSFFTFAQDLLEKYRNNDQVMHISASNFFGQYQGLKSSYYFSLYNHIWGWATWKRAWNNYQVDLLNIDISRFERKVHELFDRKIDQKFWLDIFDYAKSGNIDTWDYQWMFCMWMNNGLGITPRQNIVSNIGFGEGATNTQINQNQFNNQRSWTMDFPLIHPNDVISDKEKDLYTSDFLFKITKNARFWNLKIKIASKIPVEIKNSIKKWFY